MLLKKILLNTIGKLIPSDLFSKRYPISVKGALWVNGRVLLLKNERNEWDLPGGKIDSSESIEECLKREFKEETDLNISIAKLNSIKKIYVANRINVFVVLYTCTTEDNTDQIKISYEHKEYGFFNEESLKEIFIHPILKESIYTTITP